MCVLVVLIVIIVHAITATFFNMCVFLSFPFFSGNLALCVAINNSRDTEWRKAKKKSSFIPMGISLMFNRIRMFYKLSDNRNLENHWCWRFSVKIYVYIVTPVLVNKTVKKNSRGASM
jgi:hypothetical protein